MAEHLKLDFPVLNPEAENRDPNLQSTVVPTFKEGILEKPDDYIPEQYTIDKYYADDKLGADVLRNKYLTPEENHPWELWQRVAKATASVEKTPQAKEHWEAQFFSILEDFKFVPGGRIMHGAGRDDIKSTLNNCYVVAIEKDSIRSIYRAIQDEALTYKYGGGCGHDLSILRPSGDEIGGTGGESCGPVGFMNLFSENTNTIAQHGRRGANMQTLRVDHPDIEKFITIKSDDVNMVKYSNISVLLTHEFMRAVEKNVPFDLRWGGTVYTTINAKELWDKIVLAAHNSAEPGLLFWDTMREYHNAEYCSPLVSTNPCAEQPLPDGGCCNLGAINLDRFVDSEGNFRIDEFKDTVKIATRFLDNIVDYNLERHALDIQKQNAINDRRIGVGILGLGDMLVRMGIKYDSEDGLQTVDQVMEMFRNTAYETSMQIGAEKGSFPNYKWTGYKKSKFIKNLPKSIREDIQKNGIRNSTITTVAPTGSGAIVARVTSGIEPIFETSYKRRVKRNDGGYGKTFDEYTVYHPIIKKLFDDDKNLPDYIVTAHSIDPYFRVKIQGVIQKYIDSSISSTVNLAGDTSVETVADIYIKAYKAGLKGITVYREGSREGILISDKKKEKPKVEVSNDAQLNIVPTVQELAPAAPEPVIKIDEPVAKLKPLPLVNPGPRLRPIRTEGITQRIRTGEGTLYITINEDDDGLCEVFTTIGKAGGHAAAQSEAISRLISLALRSGINPKSIVKQLKGISGPSPNWESGRLILSTPDAIGKAIDDYLKERGADLKSNGEDAPAMQFTMATKTEEKNPKVKDFTFKNIKTCPDCGGPVRHEGGCVTCTGCGFSKCE